MNLFCNRINVCSHFCTVMKIFVKFTQDYLKFKFHSYRNKRLNFGRVFVLCMMSVDTYPEVLRECTFCYYH